MKTMVFLQKRPVTMYVCMYVYSKSTMSCSFGSDAVNWCYGYTGNTSHFEETTKNT